MISRVLVILAAIAAVSATLPAAAIVMRHDRESAAYERSADEFPALFALYRTRAGHRDCVATLIDRRWAITAAHCTEDASFTAAIAADGHRIELAGRSATIDRVVRHESADVALLHFARAPRDAEPLSLYRADDEAGRTVVVLGWGGVGNGAEGLGAEDGVFRVAENIVDVADDGWLVWRFDDPRSVVGHALTLEGISGPGDSGGPALIATAQGYAVAGVSSRQRTFGRPEGLYGAEEYYVRVSHYADWIAATINPPEATPSQ